MDPVKRRYRATSHHSHGNPHYTDHSLSNSTVFFSDYPHPSSGASISSKTFSAEPRKQADYHESPSRQSLPSISEAIQGTELGPYTSRPRSRIQTGSSLSPPCTLARRPLSKTEKHPSLQQLLPASSFPPDNMLFPSCRILLGHLAPTRRHFFLSLTAVRVPQPRGRFLPSITTPSSRRHRSLVILSAECMRTLLRRLHLQLRVPISLANYVLARCLCALL
jgi:hypothetical protein